MKVNDGKDPEKDVKDQSKSTTNTPIVEESNETNESNSVENKLKQFLDEKTKTVTPPQLPSPKEMRTLLRALHNFPAQEDGDLELERASLVWGVERRGATRGRRWGVDGHVHWEDGAA